MVKARRLKPMSLKRINMMMENYGSNFRLDEENGEIVMAMSTTQKQVQRNLFEHLKEE